MSQSVSRSAPDLYKWITFRDWDDAYWPTQVTLTGYDDPSLFASVEVGQTPFHQKSWTLRNRVSWTRYFDLLNVTNSVSGTDTSYTLVDQYFSTAIEYSYDIHGNVDSMLNIGFLGTIPYSFGKNAFKMIAYKYDLISGKVNEVHYNPGYADEFYHRYEYDADNRLTDVYTTDNKAFMGQAGLEDHDAHYTYYKHGPLARTVLGEQQVQGLDYAYTLQGWLKGVNSSSLNPAHDMGEDGKSGSVNRFVARDALGFNLNYFAGGYTVGDYSTGDYTSISGLSPFASAYAYLPSGAYKPLYNGNISSMAVNIGKFSQPQLYGYGYDQLNRLVSMDVYRGLDSTTNSWSALASTTDYKERITYDGNGNIQKYLRQGVSSISTDMDSLTYHYNQGTNQLNYVSDPIDWHNYPNDFDGQAQDNFQYDSIGNIISDAREDIYQIDWTVYGKISKLFKHPHVVGDATEIDYRYDPHGNRVQKTDWKYSAQSTIDWYARDAQGNVMAVYDMAYNSDFSFGPFKLKEHHVYGSSRLGIIQRDQDMDSVKVHPVNEGLLGPTYLYTAERGHKFYELSNHLGNVLTTISDRKFGVDGNSDGTVDYYTADIVSATDYYPFGSEMPGRTFSAESYRYGFNGKENDNDVKGDGNQQDYGMRIYDPRLGKFLSMDPFNKEYGYFSPYHFAGDNPVKNIDKDGGEPKDFEENLVPLKIVPLNGGKGEWIGFSNDPVLGYISYDAVYDKVSAQAYFVCESNDGTHYYWKANPGQDQTKYIISSKNGPNGTWAKYITRNKIVADKWNSDHTTTYLLTMPLGIAAGLTYGSLIAEAYNLYKLDEKLEEGQNNINEKTNPSNGSQGNKGTYTDRDNTSERNDNLADESDPESENNVPPAARKVVDYAKRTNGGAQSGYRGGGNFKNDGRGGGQVLPKIDSKGNVITYKEYDIKPVQSGLSRGAERVVIGSDGKSYYTGDHYKTFTEIKSVIL